VRGVADFLYPESCISCGALARCALCSLCLGGVPRLGPEMCRCCGAPTANEVDSCRDCRDRKFAFDRASQAVAFAGTVRRALLRLKYRGERTLADALTHLLVEVVGRNPAEEPFSAITWIPSSPRRLRERGFDHGRALAESVAARLALPSTSLLVKVRETPPQVGLEPEVRRTNLRGAFWCRLPSPSRVLVVDDVFTSGATASEAARALSVAGAKQVVVLAVARTLTNRIGPSYNGDEPAYGDKGSRQAPSP
jgi:competence protein ComFC